MKKIAIVGSCVTRDAFRMYEGEGLDVVYYCMNTCVPSIMSRPIAPPSNLIDGNQSPFFSRNLYRDFRKSLFQELSEVNFDAIVLDFVEERYNIFEKDGAILSDSDPLQKSPAYETVKNFMSFRKRVDINHSEFDHKFHDFAVKIGNVAGERPVFLNKVFFASSFVVGDKIHIYDKNYVQSHNCMLARYYDAFLSGLDKTFIIDSAAQNFRGDPCHQWGNFPFHYEPAFYRYLIDSLHTILNGSLHQSPLSADLRWSDTFRDEVNANWQQARSLYLDGNFAAITNLMVETAGRRPLSGDELHYYGRALLALGIRIPEAELALAAAISIGCEEGVWARIFLSQAQSKLGKIDDAVQTLNKAFDHVHNKNVHEFGQIFMAGVSVLELIQNAPSVNNVGPQLNLSAMGDFFREFWIRVQQPCHEG